MLPITTVERVENRGPVEVFEGILQETVYPGQVLQVTGTSGKYALNTVSGTPSEIIVMKEDSLYGSGADVGITSGNKVTLIRPVPGAVINGLTRASNAASGGVPMTVDQSGYWINAAAADSSAVTPPAAIAAKAVIEAPAAIPAVAIVAAIAAVAAPAVLSGADVPYSGSGNAASGALYDVPYNSTWSAAQASGIDVNMGTIATQLALIKTDLATLRTALSGACLNTAVVSGLALASSGVSGAVAALAKVSGLCELTSGISGAVSALTELSGVCVVTLAKQVRGVAMQARITTAGSASSGFTPIRIV